MKARERTFIMFALILAAVVGGLVGHIIGDFLPEGAAKTLFSKEFPIGFNATTLDLWVITMTFGFWIKINFVSVLTMLLVIVYFKWWYF
ncbi:MAG TPA: DUF4321 domain-containing protein [candidate division Zixibacteria bacterium]|nr:DUF4321 domain-containing protein [candidate division Zixibacteria bacterium]